MGEFFNRVTSQIIDFFKGLSPTKRLAVVGIGLFVAVAIVGLFWWAGATTYQPLMTNLNPEDSANIIKILREKRIPFKVDQGGKIVSVPPESLHDLRLELSTMGLPQSSVVGYEVFDKQALGVTSFVQKLNEKRALEGELIRTINTMKGVKRSRVHLATPPKSAFVEDQKKSTASVVLDLEPGTTLSEKQIYGIGNLVARSVAGLEVNDVVIVDSEGKLLSKNSSDPLAAATATQLDYKQKIEMDIEHRIEGMISKVVGEGHVVARVSADLDFSQVAETQTIYDSDGSAVRSTQKDSRSMEGVRPAPGGIAGATSNLPGAPPPQNNVVKNDTKNLAEVTNYEIPQTIRKTQKQVGTLKKLSVAVVVDGKTTKAVDKDGVVKTSVTPWPPERLKEFEDVIAQAAGLDRKRGDTLDIRNLEFTREDFEEAQRLMESAERKAYVRTLVVYGVLGATIILFFLFVVRPFVKWVTENTVDSVDNFLPQTIEELERMQKNVNLPGVEEVVPVLPERMDPEKVEGEMIKEKIITLIDSNPHKAAMILREWLHSDLGKKDKDEKGSNKAG